MRSRRLMLVEDMTSAEIGAMTLFLTVLWRPS
jgi:hypothetical protein